MFAGDVSPRHIWARVDDTETLGLVAALYGLDVVARGRLASPATTRRSRRPEPPTPLQDLRVPLPDARSSADVIDSVMEATVVPSFSRIGALVRRRLRDWTPVSQLPGAGRVVLVTGANSGLGFATASGLVSAGAAVLLLVRSEAKGSATAERLRNVEPSADVSWFVAELTDFNRCTEVAAEIVAATPRLDAVVHNAGAMFATRTENSAGVENTVALHVVGPHLLTAGLLPLLIASRARVVWMASGGMYAQALSIHRLESADDYKPATAYARAKRAQVVLAREWQQRVGRLHDVTFHSMHPGWADTPGVTDSMPIFNTLMGPLLRTPAEGADTAVWLCLAPEPLSEPGRFWLDRQPRPEHKLARTKRDQSVADELWGHVNALAGIDPIALT